MLLAQASHRMPSILNIPALILVSMRFIGDTLTLELTPESILVIPLDREGKFSLQKSRKLRRSRHEQFSRTARSGPSRASTLAARIENVDHWTIGRLPSGAFCDGRGQEALQLPKIGDLRADLPQVMAGDFLDLRAGRICRPS